MTGTLTNDIVRETLENEGVLDNINLLFRLGLSVLLRLN